MHVYIHDDPWRRVHCSSRLRVRRRTSACGTFTPGLKADRSFRKAKESLAICSPTGNAAGFDAGVPQLSTRRHRVPEEF